MIFVIWAEKGGAGKTTTAVALASNAAERGPTLIVDLDPQGNLTRWMLGSIPEDSLTLVDVLAGEATAEEAAMPVPGIENLRVIPGIRKLSSIESVLVNNPVPQFALRAALEDVPNDVTVVIDAPPAYGLLSVLGMVAADRHVLPVQPAAMDAHAVTVSLELVDQVRQQVNPSLVFAALVVTAFDERESFAHLLFDSLTAAYPDVPVVKIPTRAVVKLAPGANETLDTYAPNSPATLAYRDFSTDLLGASS